MGIRYYAYAFDADMTELAMTDPRSFISEDPLADAWGMPHGASVATPTFVQGIPKTDMLYLDKAWSAMQRLSGRSEQNGAPRPAFRMFEGQVAMIESGWIPWVRALSPDEVVEIAADLMVLEQGIDDAVESDDDTEYVRNFLRRAVEFVSHAASQNRGFVYMIG